MLVLAALMKLATTPVSEDHVFRYVFGATNETLKTSEYVYRKMAG